MTWQERFDEYFNQFQKIFDGVQRNIIKSFIQQEIDKARDEGYTEGAVAKMQFWEENPKAVALIERSRILKLIEEIIVMAPHADMNVNAALDSLKNKINDQS